MKKIMIFFILIYLFSIKSVLAQNQYKLTLQKQEGIYFSRHGENFNDDSNSYYLYRFGNMYAYCIQPGQHIVTYDYEGIENFIDLPLSEAVKEKIELIGYYGRDYPNHDNIRYSMAAQALIWELTGVDRVTFWTKQYEQGEEIDVSREKNEIMELVRRHQTIPSIEKNITGLINKEITILDKNNVLNDYEVVEKHINGVEIDNNTLKIIPKMIGEEIITLRHKAYDNSKTIIFVGKGNSDSQILGRFRFSTNREININLKVNGIKIRVNKVDEENERIKIPNIKFKIKNLNNDYLYEYQTDDSGSFTTDYLEYGEYEISEVENQIIPGYTWNQDKIKVIINEDTNFDLENVLDINFINKKITGVLTIHKLGEIFKSNDNELVYEMTNLKDIEFEIYREDQLYKTVTTDELGYAKIDNLPLGTYKIIEKNNRDNYIPNNEEKTFTILQTNQYDENISINLEFNNYLKKGILEFSKVDLNTNEGISDTVIELYDELDNLLVTEKTDENGQILINNLPYGKYYIMEKEANAMYQKTNEKVFFEIYENGENVKTKMTNEKITIEVPKTKTKEGIIVHSLFGISLLIGFGRYYYERKEIN